MTDPQDDVPCRACPTEGSRSRLDEDGLCPNCRTPAGRLVTALAARNIKAQTAKALDGVLVGRMFADADRYGWSIADADGEANDLDVTIPAAADAIAAIVQAPGLRARIVELEAENARLTSRAEVARLTAELEKPALLAWNDGHGSWRETACPARALVSAEGWRVSIVGCGEFHGPETGPAGKRAADLAALPFYRLVGGVFGEVSDG